VVGVLGRVPRTPRGRLCAGLSVEGNFTPPDRWSPMWGVSLTQNAGNLTCVCRWHMPLATFLAVGISTGIIYRGLLASHNSSGTDFQNPSRRFLSSMAWRNQSKIAMRGDSRRDFLVRLAQYFRAGRSWNFSRRLSGRWWWPRRRSKSVRVAGVQGSGCRLSARFWRLRDVLCSWRFFLLCCGW